MRNRVAFASLLAGIALAAGAVQVHAQAREEGQLLMATQILEELSATPDTFIPDRLLDRAYAIAVVPDVTKVAFIAGGRRGSGAMVVRDKNGRFSNPVFISLTGGSIGWQAGVQSTDVVLVFTTRTGVEGITGGKVTLGADASVAAGPVGRQASVATDSNFSAEVYSYSRNRGLFAGIALDGSVLSIDRSSNAEFYRKPGVTATDIMDGSVTTTDSGACGACTVGRGADLPHGRSPARDGAEVSPVRRLSGRRHKRIARPPPVNNRTRAKNPP